VVPHAAAKLIIWAGSVPTRVELCSLAVHPGHVFNTSPVCLGVDTYQAPNPEGNFDVVVDPNSKRLQLLEPFKPWDGKDLEVPPHLRCNPCCAPCVTNVLAYMHCSFSRVTLYCMSKSMCKHS
jgi:hypothetical protein